MQPKTDSTPVAQEATPSNIEAAPSDTAELRELLSRFPARYLPALRSYLRVAGSLCGSAPLAPEEQEQECQRLRQAAEQARSEGLAILAQGFELASSWTSSTAPFSD